jgi:hypothetical protein
MSEGMHFVQEVLLLEIYEDLRCKTVYEDNRKQQLTDPDDQDGASLYFFLFIYSLAIMSLLADRHVTGLLIDCLVNKSLSFEWL